jgi:predicted nucleic acid-binding protein
MVAFICGWHPDHELSRKEMRARVAPSETLVIAATALVESYSVLTRLPVPYRLSATDALFLLEANFIKQGELVSLKVEEYLSLLRSAPTKGVAGGRIYDAVILQCALRAEVAVLLTLNERHFRAFQPRRLKVVVPGDGAKRESC